MVFAWRFAHEHARPCFGSRTPATVYQRFRRWSEAGIREAVATARPGLDRAAFHFNPPGEIQLYQPTAKMRIGRGRFHDAPRALFGLF